MSYINNLAQNWSKINKKINMHIEHSANCLICLFIIYHFKNKFKFTITFKNGKNFIIGNLMIKPNQNNNWNYKSFIAKH
jgi:hypothetical protein